MKPNIGTMNAIIRISVGFTVLSWSIAMLVRGRSAYSPLLLALIGGMKIGEGITRFCPLTYLFKNSKQQISVDSDNELHSQGVINPS